MNTNCRDDKWYYGSIGECQFCEHRGCGLCRDRYFFGTKEPKMHAFVVAYKDMSGNLQWFSTTASDEAGALAAFQRYCPEGKATSIYKKTANIKMNPTVEML